MNTEIQSKHGVVRLSPAALYMQFADMRNFSQKVPQDMQVELTADYDTLHAVVQGFDIGVRVKGRHPYSKIEMEDDGAPFKFGVTVNFNVVDGEPDRTDFSIDVEAELNMMMKIMLKSRIKEALDKVVDTLVGAAV